jgi:DNA-binding CsgD family transcriptional regulator
MIEGLATFMETVAEARSVGEARDRIGRLAAGLGFGWTFLGKLRDDPVSGHSLPEDYDTDLPAFEGYLASGLYRRDPMFGLTLTSQRPVILPLDRSDWAPMSAAEREVFEGGVAHSSTLRILTPGSRGAGGVRWVAGFSADRPIPQAEASRLASGLWLAAAVLSERLLQLAPDEARPADAPSHVPGHIPGHGRLDPAEREALLRLAAGHGPGATAARLQLTDAAMATLVARAGRKLGARTGPEAVGRALARGLIEP